MKVCDDRCTDECRECAPVDYDRLRAEDTREGPYDPSKRGPKPWWVGHAGQLAESRSSVGGRVSPGYIPGRY